MMKKLHQENVRLPDDLKNLLDATAASLKLSKSDLMRECIKSHCATLSQCSKEGVDRKAQQSNFLTLGANALDSGHV